MTDRRAVLAIGERLTLTIYLGAERLAEIDLEPLRALELGSELTAAACRRLVDASSKTPRRRGGDPRPDKRARRDEALRDLARLIGADLSLQQQAVAVIRKAARYQATAADAHGTGERQALHRIAGAGLPIPQERHVRRILAKQKTCLDGQASPPPPIR